MTEPRKRGRGRPPVLEHGKPINVRVRPDQWDYLDGLARRWKISKSNVVRAIIDGLMKEEPHAREV